MNLHVLTGRLTKDGDSRKSGKGTTVYSNTIASTRRSKGSSGRYESDFFDFIVLGKYAETVAEMAKKGILVELVGEHQITKNEKNGHTYYNHVIVVDTFRVLEPKGSHESGETESTSESGDHDPLAEAGGGEEGDFDPLAETP